MRHRHPAPPWPWSSICSHLQIIEEEPKEHPEYSFQPGVSEDFLEEEEEKKEHGKARHDGT
jgi:hypothetical protein